MNVDGPDVMNLAKLVYADVVDNYDLLSRCLGDRAVDAMKALKLCSVAKGELIFSRRSMAYFRTKKPKYRSTRNEYTALPKVAYQNEQKLLDNESKQKYTYL